MKVYLIISFLLLIFTTPAFAKNSDNPPQQANKTNSVTTTQTRTQTQTQTKNSGDLNQIQQTIDLMTYQNTSLEEKINQENKINGLFGWLVNLFNR